MKKTVLFFLMTILIASCHQEEIPSVPDKPEGNQLIFDLSDEDVQCLVLQRHISDSCSC